LNFFGHDIYYFRIRVFFDSNKFIKKSLTAKRISVKLNMVFWNDGMMERWKDGIKENWKIGRLEDWKIGMA